MSYTGNVEVGGPADVRELPGVLIAKLAVGSHEQQRLPGALHRDR